MAVSFYKRLLSLWSPTAVFCVLLSHRRTRIVDAKVTMNPILAPRVMLEFASALYDRSHVSTVSMTKDQQTVKKVVTVYWTLIMSFFPSQWGTGGVPECGSVCRHFDDEDDARQELARLEGLLNAPAVPVVPVQCGAPQKISVCNVSPSVWMKRKRDDFAERMVDHPLILDIDRSLSALVHHAETRQQIIIVQVHEAEDITYEEASNVVQFLQKSLGWTVEIVGHPSDWPTSVRVTLPPDVSESE